MNRAWLVAVVCLVSCAHERTLPARVPAEPPSSPEAGTTQAPTPTNVDEPATLPDVVTDGPAPDGAPDPGDTVLASPLSPGRYATDVRYHQESACSQSWDSYHAHGSLILDLARGGSATACRTKSMHDTGPDYHTDMAERQGFRGTWRRDGAWLDVTLALADTPECPQRRGYTNLEPQSWHLRCTTLTPRPHGAAATTPITEPVVGCQFADRVYTEELGYVVQSLLNGEWVLLADGDGLRVVSDQGEPWGGPDYTVERATTPLALATWQPD